MPETFRFALRCSFLTLGIKQFRLGIAPYVHGTARRMDSPSELICCGLTSRTLMEICSNCSVCACASKGEGNIRKIMWAVCAFYFGLHLIFMFPPGSLRMSPENREPQAERNTVLTKQIALVEEFTATRGVIRLGTL
jgi:hypothetical protein